MRLTEFHKMVIKALFVIAVCMVGCRFTDGFFALVIALLGFIFALQNKIGMTITCYVIPPCFAITNRVILGLSGNLVVSAKIGTLLFLFAALMKRIDSRFVHPIPVGFLFLYLIVALISAPFGWFPMISYLKILNFAVFILCLREVVRMMQCNVKTLMQARAVIMAFAIIMIAGSALTYFMPTIGYSMNFHIAELYGINLTAEDLKEAEGGRLFNGMTYHSQSLGGIAPLFTAWVLADMLFCEKYFSKLHMVLLAVAPVLLYGTRSRTAFVSIVAVMIVMAFCISKANLPTMVRSKVRIGFAAMVALVVVGAFFAEIQDNTISRWLRKTEDVRGDSRSLSEAITSSRSGAVERNMSDFRRNPLLGMGFQVIEEHKLAYQAGAISLLSAPIEKGILPLMVLGETGVLGAFVFAIFVIVYFRYCYKRRYLTSIAVMTAFLSANMGEAYFFSPTAAGGLAWVVAGVGGFASDILAERIKYSPDYKVPCSVA